MSRYKVIKNTHNLTPFGFPYPQWQQNRVIHQHTIRISYTTTSSTRNDLRPLITLSKSGNTLNGLLWLIMIDFWVLDFGNYKQESRIANKSNAFVLFPSTWVKKKWENKESEKLANLWPLEIWMNYNLVFDANIFIISWLCVKFNWWFTVIYHGYNDRKVLQGIWYNY